MSEALPGNLYEAEANVGRDYFEDVDNFRLAQSTLALAYEQRTANLIAYEAGLSQAFRDNAINDDGLRLWKLAADQINERLGL